MVGHEGTIWFKDLMRLIDPRSSKRGGAIDHDQISRPALVQALGEAISAVKILRLALYRGSTFTRLSPEARLLALLIILRGVSPKALTEFVHRGYSHLDDLFESAVKFPAAATKAEGSDRLAENRSAEWLSQAAKEMATEEREAFVSPEWKALGERLGFLAAAEHLAVLECSSDVSRGEVHDRIVEDRVRGVGHEIRAAGFPDYSIFVAVTDPTTELSSRLFEAGAYDLPVPTGYWKKDTLGRLNAVRGLIRVPDKGDAFLDEAPSRPTPPPPLADDYTGRNPALSPAQVREWFESHSRPAHRN